MDAAHGGVVPAFDHVKLAAALAQASGKEVKAEKLPLGDWRRADDGRLDVTVRGNHYLYDLSCKGACDGQPEPKEPAVFASGSEERRVRKECVSSVRYSGSTEPLKDKKEKK